MLNQCHLVSGMDLGHVELRLHGVDPVAVVSLASAAGEVVCLAVLRVCLACPAAPAVAACAFLPARPSAAPHPPGDLAAAGDPESTQLKTITIRVSSGKVK